MRIQIARIFVLMASILISCREVEQNSSEVKYEILDNIKWKAGLTRHIFASELRVCYTGETTGFDVKKETPQLIARWLNPIRAKYSKVVTKVVESCKNPHLKLNVDAKVTREHCYPSPTPIINIKPSSDSAVIFHELGHAFGIGDTYVEGIWTCESGQPLSMMCNHHNLKVDLMEDDRNAILAVVDIIYPRRAPEVDCPQKVFRNQSAHSFVEFVLPGEPSGAVIEVPQGAYNKYVAPKCNRVWWSDLRFICTGGAWVKASGKWDADGLCHGNKGGSNVHVRVGDL